MSKFTPGPWVVDSDEEGVYITAPDLVGEDEMLPVYLTPSEYGETRWADANLISAAPDMYEALNEILTLLGLIPLDKNVLGAISLAEQALWKAGGESHE